MAAKRNSEEHCDLVEKIVREKARKAAHRLISEVSQKAARDVDVRLRYLSPEPNSQKHQAPSEVRCGRPDVDNSDLSQGLEQLFERYYKLGMSALNRGDASTAAFYLGKCLLMPVADDIKLRQMVRHNLRLALSLQERLKSE